MNLTEKWMVSALVELRLKRIMTQGDSNPVGGPATSNSRCLKVWPGEPGEPGDKEKERP